MKKVLIIKLGYTETLDNSLSLTTSLGDVLRTTFILHFFKDWHISWLVDEKATPLLENNRYIDRIFIYESNNILKQLRGEVFDAVVNFEKLPAICGLANSIGAREYFGFRLNSPDNCIIHHTEEGKRLVQLSQDVNKRRGNSDCWQKILSEALGRNWNGESYILGYTPRSKIRYDIGFNWATSNKWTNKEWPKAYWHELYSLLKDKYSISWQQGLNSLYEYIDWINSCRLIVTTDSLGLHLSLVLKKRLVALFGPTSHLEIYFYNCGSFLLPESPYNCLPCLKPVCDKEKKCIEYIYPERVKERIEHEFKKHISPREI